MRNRHFRAPLTFDNARFSRGYKKENKFPISTAVIGTFLKSVYIFLLMAIDLVLFTDSGNLDIFCTDNSLTVELSGLLLWLLVFSFLIMILTSFSKVLQNIICVIMSFLFVTVLFTQFAQFNIESFIGDWLQNLIGTTVPGFLYSNSHIIIGIILAVLVLWLFWQCSLWIVAVYVLMFAIAFFGILRHSINNRQNRHDFIETYQSQIKNTATEHDKKFVYLMLPNLNSYKYFTALNIPQAENTAGIINGFYRHNNFELFVNAYNENNDGFMNMVRAVNPLSTDNPENHILNTMLLYRYWKFFNVNDEYIFLKDNQLFDTFRKAGYGISAYKSRGFDLCHKNHMLNVDRCVEKLNRPVNLYSLAMSPKDRSQMLLLEWLSSTKLFKNMSGVYQALRIFGEPEKIPLVGINYNNLYVINSVKTLDILAENIIQDKGRQAYFVYADIPSDMFIYDEFCNFKPRDEWINMENMPWITKDNTAAKKQAYFDQTKCLYGKLQEFIDKLAQAGILDNTVIIINGVSGVNDFKNSIDEQFIDEFIYNKLTNVAIRTPSSNSFKANEQICSAPSIISEYLYKSGGCNGLDNINIHPSLKEHLRDRLKSLERTEEQNKQDTQFFEVWYKAWYSSNHEQSVPEIDVVRKNSETNNEQNQLNTDNTPELKHELLQHPQAGLEVK